MQDRISKFLLALVHNKPMSLPDLYVYIVYKKIHKSKVYAMSIKELNLVS